jgi:hypothetical protein
MGAAEIRQLEFTHIRFAANCPSQPPSASNVSTRALIVVWGFLYPSLCGTPLYLRANWAIRGTDGALSGIPRDMTVSKRLVRVFKLSSTLHAPTQFIVYYRI